MKRAMRTSDPKRLLNDASVLSEEDIGPDDHRQQFIFYQDEGGLRATDETNEAMGTIYYLGIIDILTPWGVRKRGERWWKGMKDDIVSSKLVPCSGQTNSYCYSSI